MLFSANNKEMLPHNIFVHLHGSAAFQLAEAKYITGLYTIQESNYRLLFDSRSYPIEHLPSVPTRGAPPQRYRVHQSNKGQEVRGGSGDWQSQFFQLSDTIEFPLSAKARLDEKGLELRIRNDSQEIVQDALLYFQQGLYLLGTLPAGEEWSHHIPLADIRERSSFDPSEFEREKYKAQRPEKDSEQERQMTGYIREMLRKLFARQNVAAYAPAMRKKLLPAVLDSVHARYQARPDVLCLVGWQPKSPIDMSVSWNGEEGKSLSLLTWEIGLD
jgi:hypothetical protein